MDTMNLVLGLLLIDFISDYFSKRVFKSESSVWYVVFLQIPKFCGNLLIIDLVLNVWLKLVIRLGIIMISLIFLTDSFRISRIFKLFLLKLIFEVSLIGFLTFTCLWVGGMVEQLLLIQLTSTMKVLVLIIALLYILSVFILVRNLENKKKFGNFLAKISLSLMDKHIRFYALVDSGNSLLDPLTKRPVLLISKESLSRFIGEENMKLLIDNSRFLKCQAISGVQINIPIISIQKIIINFNGFSKEYKCALGVVENRFERGKYDCLLPRDIM